MKMRVFAASLFALLLAGCAMPPVSSVCDGIAKLTPNVDSRAVMVAKDRPFAEQVASHNAFGHGQKCW